MCCCIHNIHILLDFGDLYYSEYIYFRRKIYILNGIGSIHICMYLSDKAQHSSQPSKQNILYTHDDDDDAWMMMMGKWKIFSVLCSVIY